MVMQERIDEILKKVANKHGLKLVIVTKIWLSQWELLRKVIEMGERGKLETFKSMYIPSFGTFRVKYPSKIFYITRKRLEKEDKLAALKADKKNGCEKYKILKKRNG